MTKPISWYAERYVSKFGWHLVPIEPRRKFPTSDDWGNNLLSEPESACAFYDDRTDWNMGMALGPSRMCSLDIDCEESLAVIMAEFGIPMSELDKYPTIKGSDKGRRLLFRVPDGVVLPYCKLNWPTRDDAAKRYTVFELRAACDGKQRQDVLPPSWHPTANRPYAWQVQPAASLDDWPTPPEWLLAIWGAWDAFKPQLQDACPWSVKAKPVPPAAPTRPRGYADGPTPIDEHLARVPLTQALEQYGYKRKGKRWLSPHSTTGLPGVIVDADRCWICHASDPLCSEDTGKPVNAFDLYCYYEHGGDVSAAVKQLASDYDMKPKRKPSLLPVTPAPVSAADQPDTPATPAPELPFKALGYNGTGYYYLPRGTEQVVEIRRSGHTSPGELMSLASIEWWESHFGKDKGGIDWQWAASELMRQCERAGIYSHERERGRGAWFDAGRCVYHLGDSLLVDGKRCAIIEHDSRYIYTRQPPMEHGTAAKPCTADTAAELASLCADLNWIKPLHGKLIAGWLALAPICGALSWRPHLWLTAQRGAGKTWVQDNIIAPVLGSAALVVQGSTTEAGIRQRLRQDARPIVFDEAEAEGQKGAARMQTIIELARQSSSDSTAEIVKGTVGGTAMAFRMRSMFLLGSINVSLNGAADESRFSVVQLAKGKRTAAEFDEYARRVGTLLTRDYCAAIRARSYAMIPTIRANAAVLAAAVGDLLGSQRTGDQVGTLLAGYCSLLSDAVLTPGEAAAMVAGLDFTDAREADDVSDSDLCLQTILQAQVRVDEDGRLVTRTLGELVQSAAYDGLLGAVAGSNDALARFGIRVADGYLYISNNHSELKRIMRDTAWAAGWRRVLARIDGVDDSSKVIRMAGSVTRCVAIPLASIQ